MIPNKQFQVFETELDKGSPSIPLFEDNLTLSLSHFVKGHKKYANLTIYSMVTD